MLRWVLNGGCQSVLARKELDCFLLGMFYFAFSFFFSVNPLITLSFEILETKTNLKQISLDYIFCTRDAKIFSEKRITCHIVLFPGFKLIMLFLDISDVISFTFGRMTSMPRRRKQLPSWVVYKLEFCQENRGMKCRGTKPQYWRARSAWKKKKKSLHHLKWSFSLFVFSHRDSCSTGW